MKKNDSKKNIYMEDNNMDIAKRNIQLMIEEIYNSCEVGELFEDRDKLKELRNNLYKVVEELDEYERDNFNI